MKRKNENSRFVIKASCVDFKNKCVRWDFIASGNKNSDLEKEVDAMNYSILYGQNHHLTPFQSLYSNAKLFDQRNNKMKIVKEYKAPMFKEIPAMAA